MKILISGGGIAGNALAFWLSKVGHDVTVIERFPSLRDTGLQIDLRGHGIEVMKRMGLEEAFRARSAPEQGLQLVDKFGKRRAYFPANRSGKGVQSFTTDYEIMRGDLCRLIYDATKHRARYEFGNSIKSFENRGREIEVIFMDGKVQRYDLLVGADGQGSRTRKLMLGSDTNDAFYPLGGQYIGYFTYPKPAEEGEEYLATAYIAPGRRSMMTRRSDPHKMQVYLGGRTDSERLKTRDVGEQKKALADFLQGAGWQTEEFLEAMMEAGDFYCERLGLVKLDAWSQGRVTLIGDAAYCPTANTGMGTTSSIVGAYILAGEIATRCGKDTVEGSNDADGLVTALQAYEAKFRPFMEQVTRDLIKELTEGPGFWDGLFSTSLGIAMLNRFMGLASFLRLDVPGWFLKETIKDWELPKYEEMIRD